MSDNVCSVNFGSGGRAGRGRGRGGAGEMGPAGPDNDSLVLTHGVFYLSLNTILAQYGFPVDEITSKTSHTLQATESINASLFEDVCEDLFTQKNLERTSNAAHDVNSNSCKDLEDCEDIPGVLAKVAEKANLKEVRI